jgi:hypothetical protein
MEYYISHAGVPESVIIGTRIPELGQKIEG